MTDKRDRELWLQQIERQDDRLERVEEDVRSFQESLQLQQKMVVILDYQSKLIEELKKTLYELAEDNKEVAQRNLQQHTSQTSDIANIKTEIELLKLKSGWWGAIGGIIAFVALLAIEFLKAGFK